MKEEKRSERMERDARPGKINYKGNHDKILRKRKNQNSMGIAISSKSTLM